MFDRGFTFNFIFLIFLADVISSVTSDGEGGRTGFRYCVGWCLYSKIRFQAYGPYTLNDRTRGVFFVNRKMKLQRLDTRAFHSGVTPRILMQFYSWKSPGKYRTVGYTMRKTVMGVHIKLWQKWHNHFFFY